MALDAWWNFFYLCGSAAATLMAIMFVAVTLGTSLIKKDTLDKVHAFLSPSCYHFLHVFFLCALTAVPRHTAVVVASGCVLSGLLRLVRLPRVYNVVRRQMDHDDTDLSDLWMTVGVPGLVYAGFVAAGAGLWLGQEWGVDTLAISCMALLLCSVSYAWDMLLWIASTLT